MDNSIELRYRYKNYLSKDLTGLQGKFELDWEVEDNSDNSEDLFNLCICITKKDDTVQIINTKNTIFELTGDEKEVIVYMRLNTKDENLEQIHTFIAKPRILSVSESDNRLRYNYRDSGNAITVRVNNREYKYGDNSSENIIEFYNKLGTFATFSFNSIYMIFILKIINYIKD